MSLYPSLQGSLNNRGGTLSSPSPIFFARVKDISLSPNTQTNNFFNDAQGWAGLGFIKFTPIGVTIDNSISNLIAKPLFTNISQYPILEEIVLILQAPSIELNDDPQAKTYYYLTTVGLWNNINHNVFPDINIFNEKIQQGEVELKLGNTFREKSDIRKLLPEEGDLILEGRWGQSIRFSSITSDKQPTNSWSSQGELGLPITIIRNGQTKNNITREPWIPIYEDINNDGSSIYLCSGQDIPLELASKNLQSFGVTVGSAFNPSLQIPDINIIVENESPKQADNLNNGSI
jgi:hypothetical protein